LSSNNIFHHHHLHDEGLLRALHPGPALEAGGNWGDGRGPMELGVQVLIKRLIVINKSVISQPAVQPKRMFRLLFSHEYPRRNALTPAPDV
jgi:hypothetical protein